MPVRPELLQWKRQLEEAKRWFHYIEARYETLQLYKAEGIPLAPDEQAFLDLLQALDRRANQGHRIKPHQIMTLITLAHASEIPEQ